MPILQHLPLPFLIVGAAWPAVMVAMYFVFGRIYHHDHLRNLHKVASESHSRHMALSSINPLRERGVR